MSNKLYVGNLPYSVTDADLADRFGEFGTVTSASVVIDRETGRSRGFGFVEMSTQDEAEAAMRGMNGAQMGGRTLKVDLARPRADQGRPRQGGDRRDRGW